MQIGHKINRFALKIMRGTFLLLMKMQRSFGEKAKSVQSSDRGMHHICIRPDNFWARDSAASSRRITTQHFHYYYLMKTSINWSKIKRDQIFGEQRECLNILNYILILFSVIALIVAVQFAVVVDSMGLCFGGYPACCQGGKNTCGPFCASCSRWAQPENICHRLSSIVRLERDYPTLPPCPSLDHSFQWICVLSGLESSSWTWWCLIRWASGAAPPTCSGIEQ